MKDLKTITLTIVTILLTMTTNAQTSKIYNGPYIMASNVDGMANYKYLEGEDSERIKEGLFSFKGSRNNEIFTITGNYKNNLKNGKWTTKIELSRVNNFIRPPKPSDNVGALKTEGISIMTGSYIDGKRNGLWSFAGGKAADGISKSSIKSTANFKNGLLDGSFESNIYDPGAINYISISAIGQFSDGVIDGKWTFKYMGDNKIEFTRIMLFNDGLCESSKIIDNSTGNVKIETDDIPSDDDQYIIIDIRSYFSDEITSTVISPWLLDPSLESQVFFHGLGYEEWMKISPAFGKCAE